MGTQGDSSPWDMFPWVVYPMFVCLAIFCLCSLAYFCLFFFFPIYVLTSDCEVFFSNPLPLQKIKLLPFFQNKYFLKFRNKKYNDFYQICLFFFLKMSYRYQKQKNKNVIKQAPNFFFFFFFFRTNKTICWATNIEKN